VPDRRPTDAAKIVAIVGGSAEKYRLAAKGE
jgi:hypothetical protein